jgi:hypothetical protein
MDYSDLDTDECELPRKCPVCGKWEPVSVDTLEQAREEGLPDSWVCFECWVTKATRALTPAAAEGG